MKHLHIIDDIFDSNFVSLTSEKTGTIIVDIEIDKLTNSIQNTISGDSFATDILRLTLNDIKQVTKKNGWNFNWKSELADGSRNRWKSIVYSEFVWKRENLLPRYAVGNESDQYSGGGSPKILRNVGKFIKQ